MRGSIDNGFLQLVSNTLGSRPFAAHALLDNACMRVLDEPLDPLRLARGVRELNDIVVIAAAMVHIASERITMELLEDRIAENAIDRPRVCVTETVNVFRAARSIDSLTLLTPPPAQVASPLLQPHQGHVSHVPEMSRERLLGTDQVDEHGSVVIDAMVFHNGRMRQRRELLHGMLRSQFQIFESILH